MQDLSENKYSATSAFIRVKPSILELQNRDCSEQEKVRLALQLINYELINTQRSCPSHNKKSGISTKYIENVRQNVLAQSGLNGVIRYLDNAINKGKNYNGGN